VSLWPRERLSIGIGAEAVSCARAGLDGPASTPMALSAGMDEVAKTLHLEAALGSLLHGASQRSVKTQVVVADGLARHWILQPPPTVRSLAELRAVAQARCMQLFGASQSWQIEADWHARRAFLCVAIPARIVDGARSAFGHRVAVRTALAVFLSKQAGKFPRNGWVCWTFPGSTCLMGVVEGRLHSLRTLRSGFSDGWAERLARAAQELRREELRTGLPIDAPVGWAHAGSLSPETASAEQVEIEGLRFMPLRQEVPMKIDPLVGPHADAEVAACLAAAC